MENANNHINILARSCPRPKFCTRRMWHSVTRAGRRWLTTSRSWRCCRWRRRTPRWPRPCRPPRFVQNLVFISLTCFILMKCDVLTFIKLHAYCCMNIQCRQIVFLFEICPLLSWCKTYFFRNPKLFVTCALYGIFILQAKELQTEIVQAEYEHRRLDDYNYKVQTEKEEKVSKVIC